MKYPPYEPPLKSVPLALVRLLVEEGLNQPKPTRGLRNILQTILEHGKHRDRLR